MSADCPACSTVILTRRTFGEFNQRCIRIFKVFNSHGLLLEVPIKKGIVNSLTGFEQDNKQDPISHFRGARSTANSPIGLYLFTQWISDTAFNPFVQNQ